MDIIISALGEALPIVVIFGVAVGLAYFPPFVRFLRRFDR